MTPPPLVLRPSPSPSPALSSQRHAAGPSADFSLSPRLSQQLASRFSGSTISTTHLKTPRHDPSPSQSYQNWSPEPVSPSPSPRHRRTMSSGGNFVSPRRQLMLGEREPIVEDSEEEVSPREQKDSLVDGLKAAFSAPRWAHLEANKMAGRHSLPPLPSPTSPIIPMQGFKTSSRPLPPTRAVPAIPRSMNKTAPISPTQDSPPLPEPPVSPDESFLSFPTSTPGTTTPPRHLLTPSPGASIRHSHLPPRSDSRGGFFTPPKSTPEISTPSSVASSSYQGIPNPRFSGSRRPRFITAPSPTPSLTVQAPFKAVILQSPSPASASKQGQEERLVSLNVGGTIFVTLASTLSEGGGELGEFVQEVFDTVEVSLATIEGDGSAAKEDGLYAETEEDRESFLDATHFDLSPFPSPFPFMRHDTNSPHKMFDEEEKWIPLDFDSMNLPESPMDRNFFTVLNSNQPHQVSHQVSSPRPHLRIQSIHPSIVTYRSDSGDDDEDNLTLSSTPPLKSPACTTPRRPSPSRVESNPFEKSLASPFFQVIKGQQNRSPSTPEHPPFLDAPTSRPPSLSMSASSTEEGEIIIGQEIALDVSGRTLEIFLDRDPTLFIAILAHLQTHSLPATHSLPPPTQTLPPLFPLVDPDFLDLLVLDPTMIITLLASLRSLILEARWYGLKSLEASCDEEISRIGSVVRYMVEEKRKEERRVKAVAAQSKAGWI